MRNALLVFLSLFFTVKLIGQEVKVYESLSGGKYDRTVTLKQIVEISDKSGEFLFKRPTLVKIADDGTIFIQNNMNQELLKFSSDGKYLGNLIKKGEGPGEMRFSFEAFILNKRLFVFCNAGQKYMEMDFTGNVISENRIPNKMPTHPEGTIGNNFIVSYNCSNEALRLNVINHQLCYSILNIKSNTLKFLYKGPPIRMVKKNKHFPSMQREAYVGKGKLFKFHDPKYEFSLVDLTYSGKTATYKRKFTPILLSCQEKKKKRELADKYQIPYHEHKDAIQMVYKMENEFWIKTAYKRGNTSEIDVYNLDGNYIDHFYFNPSTVPGRLSINYKNYFIKKDHSEDDDETYIIRICRPVGL